MRVSLRDSYAIVEGKRLIIGNDFFEREWTFTGGGIRTVGFYNKINGRRLVDPLAAGHEVLITHGEGWFDLATSECFDRVEASAEVEREGASDEACLHVVFSAASSFTDTPNRESEFHIRKHMIIYPGIPGFQIYLELSSTAPVGNLAYSSIDSFGLPFEEMRIHWAQLYDFTDVKDEVVVEGCERYKREDEVRLRCSVALIEDVDGSGLFLWRESPVPASQPFPTLWDLKMKKGVLSFPGIGFHEISPGRLRKTYGVGLGVYDGGFEHGILSLKEYQRRRYDMVPERDCLINTNSWPDYREDINEVKILREIDRAHELGLTHVTIDMGWFAHHMGDIDTVRFPGGFERLAEHAREKGVRLGLWVNPVCMAADHPELLKHPEWVARNNSHVPVEIKVVSGERVHSVDLCHPGYFEYFKDRLLKWYRLYGIERFKFDYYQLARHNTLLGDAHDHYLAMERLLTEVQKEEPAIRISMDATRGNRPVYHFALGHGTIFLENRYQNKEGVNKYRPWMTLRNLWTLSPYIPPQRLEMELCNDEEGYRASYLLATVIFANPLFWEALANISDDSYQELLWFMKIYRAHRLDIMRGHIFRIGEEPDGRSWTGLQSHNPTEGRGYLLLFREGSPESQFRVFPRFLEGERVFFRSLTDNSEPFVKEGGEESFLCELNDIFTFRLYQYQFPSSV